MTNGPVDPYNEAVHMFLGISALFIFSHLKLINFNFDLVHPISHFDYIFHVFYATGHSYLFNIVVFLHFNPEYFLSCTSHTTFSSNSSLKWSWIESKGEKKLKYTTNSIIRRNFEIKLMQRNVLSASDTDKLKTMNVCLEKDVLTLPFEEV